MGLDGVASMRKPLTTMSRGHSEARTSGYAAQGNRVAGREATNLLLLESPAELDGVEVVRVGRQVDHANAACSAQRGDARVVMCGQVVEDEYVALPKLGKQLHCQPVDETVLVRAGEHRGEEDPARQAHRAEQREVPAPVHGNSFDELAAPLYPSVAACHRRIEAGLVEEHQAMRRYPPDPAPEGGSLGDDVRPELLKRTKTFFLTTYPARYSARLMLETCR